MFGCANVIGKATTFAFVVASKQCGRHVARPYGTSSTLQATQFLLRYDYIPDVLEKRGPHREGHIKLAKKFIEEGKCLSGGPTGEVGMGMEGVPPTGALFIFADAASAKAYVEGDPYVANGIVTGHSIEEWNVVVQKE